MMRQRGQEKNALGFDFGSVCPEPVLANDRLSHRTLAPLSYLVYARLGVETVVHPVIIKQVLRCTGHAVVEVGAHHPRVGVHNAVDIVDVLSV